MTDRYAVFGNPIGHTKSPEIHMAFARQTGQDMSYEAIDAPNDGFAAAVETFRQEGGKGINITVPFKLEALQLATRRLQRAELAGASNCLKFEDDVIIADNFDGIGLVRDIEQNHDHKIEGRTVLIVGAGGAARGAVPPILEAGPARLAIVNRTVERAQELRTAFSGFGSVEAYGFDTLPADPFDLVINATSTGLFGDAPPIGEDHFNPDGLAYEMVYGKGLTPFLRLAGQKGVTCLVDGVGMLVEQAAEAFAWWRGVRPDTGPVIEKMTVPLE